MAYKVGNLSINRIFDYKFLQYVKEKERNVVFSQQIPLEIMVPVVKALPATMEGFLEAPESAQQARASIYYNFLFIQTVIMCHLNWDKFAL